MKEQITYDIFDKVDIRVGTVISVKKNEKARKPSLVIKVDFGEEIGIKQSSAQITHYYNEDNLKGKQVIGVCNFPEKNIAGVVSQVLILGSIDKKGKFGRLLGELISRDGEQNANQMLLQEGHAVKYFGGKKTK
jgi:tRNA-binding protein